MVLLSILSLKLVGKRMGQK